MPRYGGSSGARTGAVKTEMRWSVVSAYSRTWSSRPSQQLLRLVEPRRLRSGIRVEERRGRRLARFGDGSPARVAATDEMASIEVVVRVDGGSGLLGRRDPRVELPLAASLEVEQQLRRRC